MKFVKEEMAINHVENSMVPFKSLRSIFNTWILLGLLCPGLLFAQTPPSPSSYDSDEDEMLKQAIALSLKGTEGGDNGNKGKSGTGSDNDSESESESASEEDEISDLDILFSLIFRVQKEMGVDAGNETIKAIAKLYSHDLGIDIKDKYLDKLIEMAKFKILFEDDEEDGNSTSDDDESVTSAVTVATDTVESMDKALGPDRFYSDTTTFRGLENLGNTCFLNGALKLLVADDKFAKNISKSRIAKEKEVTSKMKDDKLDKSRSSKAQKRMKNHLLALFVEIKRLGSSYKGRSTEDMRHRKVVKLLKKFIKDFKRILVTKNEQFSGTTEPRIPGQQNDPAEFLQKVFDYIEYKKKFGFELADTVHWDDKNAPSVGVVTKNSMLEVPVKYYEADAESPIGVKTVKIRNVQEAINKYFENERVQGSESNNNVPGSKSFKLLNAPDSLFVNLKRFGVDMLTGEVERVGHKVDVTPIQVNVYDKDGRQIGVAHYGPQAVEVHQGQGTDSGHYYTYIQGQKGWVEHNDSAKPSYAPTGSNDINKNGYIIKYKLLKVVDVPDEEEE